MAVFEILLAQDVTHYGSVLVEADTWEEAVRSLEADVWWQECNDPGDVGWEERVVHVEDDTGRVVADDLNYNCAMIHSFPVIHRLTVIRDTLGLSHEATAAITAYIDELRTMVQDPIFNKETQA
jgi:hypothetical protein